MYKEKHSRTVLKTITWRFTATVTTVTLVWLFTGEVGAALAIGGIEVFLKMLFYYLHERAWDAINFGREEVEPFVLWFTGLPDSGKTTIADAVHKKLSENGRKIERLDSHTVRALFPATGFSREERNRHIERVGYLAGILEQNNISVIASFISPYKESRQKVRDLAGNFIEVYVNTPAEICEQRDAKGNWRKARRGEIKQFTGVDDPYEAPEKPELTIDASDSSPQQNAEVIVGYLKKRKFV